jgi:LPS export ABC transporter protein LptC/lipopolysaccharide transport protein LptA
VTRWQRRARLVIAVSAVLFAVVLAWQWKPRQPPAVNATVPRNDPGAAIEVAGGRLERFKMSRQDVSVEFQRQSMYANGSMKLYGVTIVADEKDGNGALKATGKEADVGPDATTIDLRGNVRLESAEVTAHTDHATFAKTENIVRTPGSVELTEGKTTAKGVGMNFDRDRDVLTILDHAVISMGSDSGGTTEISSGTAIFARREHYRQFDRSVRLQRGGQLIEADTAVVHLSEDSKRIETIELRGTTKITAPNAEPGALRELNGHDVTLTYAPDGEALQHVVIGSAAAIQIAGEAGKAGREIVAGMMDIGLAPDGSTPTALNARDAVRLTIPPEGNAAGRTIQAATLNATGEPGRGLSRAVFNGNVQFRERGPNVNRAASSATLDVGLKRGMSELEDAKFAHAVRFEEGKLVATAAAARYDPEKGTLQLSGSEPGAPAPHVVNDQIAIDAAKVDVTLEGPKVKAAAAGTGKVKSILQPQKADAGEGQGGERKTKMPSMLKQDQPVNVTASALDYDGTISKTVYEGAAQLWQGDTSIKGESIAIDGKSGDMAVTAVTSATVLEQTNKDNTKERLRSVATAKDLKYEDEQRRLIYTGDAHMSSPEGDMTAVKIELYLKPSGNELDRAEAYENVTLREQNRKTTGARMTYTTSDERYVIVGARVKIVYLCERETTGKTLTFVKSTDSIVVDGNSQIRTLTKGGGKCSS